MSFMVKLFCRQPGLGQYHKGNGEWIVEFTQENDEYFVNPTTGSTGGTGLSTRRTISFKTKELATKYLNANFSDYKIIESPEVPDLFFNSYTKNFI